MAVRLLRIAHRLPHRLQSRCDEACQGALRANPAVRNSDRRSVDAEAWTRVTHFAAVARRALAALCGSTRDGGCAEARSLCQDWAGT